MEVPSMRRLPLPSPLASFFHLIGKGLIEKGFSPERAVANVQGDLVDLDRAIASVDAIAMRVATRAAYGYAA
jgi:hypothetical protein